MKRKLLLFAGAALLEPGYGRAFSAHDDLLAFPQYEIDFADSFILQSDASALTLRQHVTEDPSTPSPVPPPHAPAAAAAPPDSYEPMILGSTSYLCAVPHVKPTALSAAIPPAPSALSAAEQEKEVARATDRGGELLRPMEGHCLYFVSGWWSYSFCYNEEVKQFHALPPGRHGVPLWPPVEDSEVPAFILGEFDAVMDPRGGPPPPASQSSPPRPSGGGSSEGKPSAERGLAVMPRVHAQGDTRYLVQRLGGGTVCDITGRPRRVEVQYRCEDGAADHIGHIKETSTCAYRMVIHTPRLCNDVAFLPPKTRAASRVVCREVLAPQEVDAWRQKKAREAERRLIGGGPPAGAKGKDGEAGTERQFVGGIEVGGFKQVGRDGPRIEPPGPFNPAAVAAASQKTETLASYHPLDHDGQVWKMPREQLKKLDLSATSVNQMIDEMREIADGQPWKVELLETSPGKRELRGVVEEEGEEGEMEWERLKDEL